MTTETELREKVLALLTEHPDLEYRPRELPALIEVDVEVDVLQAALQPLFDAGTLVCRRAGRGVFYSVPTPVDAQPQDAKPVPATFNAAAWADGDVDLYGAIELDDGGVRLTAPMVAKLKRLIAWMPVPA